MYSTSPVLCGAFFIDTTVSHPFSLSKREIPPTMLAPEFTLVSTSEVIMHQMIEKKKPVQKKKQVERPVGVAPEVIEDAVLKIMGKPKNFYQINALNLYDNRWRVDIWTSYVAKDSMTGLDSYKISYSYFCHVQGNEIVKSMPEIGQPFPKIEKPLRL